MTEAHMETSFLPDSSSPRKKRLRKGPRVAVIVTAVVVSLLILAAIGGVLYWYFTVGSNGDDSGGQDGKAVRIYSGHLTLASVPYSSQLEIPDSTEFKELAEKLEQVINTTCLNAGELSSYFVNSRVIDYSEGSNLMAYYMAKFEIPSEQKDVLPKFSEDALTGILRKTVQESRSSVQYKDLTITSASAS
ncbi:suppressor of tumorigenicity 14 protein homolog, partial [Mustelus asterias]